MPVQATARLSLNIPVEIAERLETEMRRSGRTKTDLVVEALEALLAEAAAKKSE